MPLGTEVGLGAGHIVLDADPAIRKGEQTKRGHIAAHALWAKGWMDQDAT